MNKALPSIQHLKYLSALAKHNSFSKAADFCNVTQSTLSSGIKELENLLQYPLAIRNSRSVTLTPFGRDILKQSQKILDDASYIMHLSKVAAQPMSGKMRIGIIPTIAPYFLPSTLINIKKHYPALEIELYESLTHQLIHQINENILDIAIIAFPYETNNLERHVFFKDYFSYVTNKQHLVKKPIENLSSRIDYADLLILTDGHCLRDHVLSACKLSQKKLGSENVFQLSNIDTLLELVKQGYGNTLLPDIILHNKILDPDIQVIPLKKPRPYREIGAIWRGDNSLNDDIKKLIKTLS